MNKKLTLNDAQNSIVKYDRYYLSTEYMDYKSLMRWKCCCEHFFDFCCKSISNIKTRIHRTKFCTQIYQYTKNERIWNHVYF